MSGRKFESIFPVPLATATFDADAVFEAASQAILNIIRADLPIRNRHNAITTPDDLHIRPEFAALHKLIDDEVKHYLAQVYTMEPQDCAMTGMWSNVALAGATHHIHVHPNSFLSGVIYLNVPPGSGDLFFTRPGFDVYHPNYRNWHPFTARSLNVTPARGMMMLFPSYLPHGTEPGTQESGEHRISLSFNYALKKSDYYTGRLNFK